MIGVATGLTIGAAVLSFILSTSYKTERYCRELHNNEAATNQSNHTTAFGENKNENVFTTACSTGIHFWAGLAAWLSVVTAMLFVTGRHELSEHYQHYDSIGGAHGGGGGNNIYNDNNNPHMSGSGSSQHHDFEETFRRQQQEILGASQAAAIQNRAASMFVGDYASIPEVRTGTGDPANSSMSTVTLASSQAQAQPLNNGSNNRKKKDPQVLSV